MAAKSVKKQARLRRARRTRLKISELGVPRLCVHRTPRHTYAQILAPAGREVLASASTLEAEVRKALKGRTGNIEAAVAVGKLIADRAKALGMESAAFDRSGYRYHGRVKALADAAREQGLRL